MMVAKCFICVATGIPFDTSLVGMLIMIAFGVIWIAQYVIRARLAGKKLMILVPRARLSDEYFGYGDTVYAHPQGDGEGHLLPPATNAEAVASARSGKED